MARRAVVFAGIFLALASCAVAQDQWLAVTGGTVIDGAGAVLRDATVLVRGNRIEHVGPAAGVRIPEGARRVDARGKFVVPGFVDLHFHFDPDTSPWLPLLFLANGVTTQREMGNWIEADQHWLAATKQRGEPVPRLLFTGPLLDGPHPAYPGGSITLLDEMDARREVNRLADKGATSVKVYFRLPLSLSKAVIDEAHKRGLLAHAHLELVDARDMIPLGLDGLEHTTSLGRSLLPPAESEKFRQDVWRDNALRGPGRYRVWARINPAGPEADSLIQLMLAHKVNLDATLAVFEPRRGEPGNDERWRALRNQAAFTVRYFRAGGSVTIGSHGEVPNALSGFAFQREMEAHAEAGMSPADVLQAATRVGAAALRLNDRGVLAPGKLADLVVLDADPLVNISNASRVHTVVLDGKVLDRAALLATRPAALPSRTGEPPPR